MNGTAKTVKNKTRTILFASAIILLGAIFALPVGNTWAKSTSDVSGSSGGSSGLHAVKNGQALESIIETTLAGRGFSAVNYLTWRQNPDAHSADVLLKNVPYTTVYGTQGRTEFVLKSTRLPGPIRIEAKWQQTPGSTDERLPYLYLNASRFDTMPEAHVIIVIDGQGWRAGALNWLRKTAQIAPEGKQIKVMNLQQFVSWANQL